MGICKQMKILNIKPEDFTNYRKPSMFIGMGTCNFKCCTEAGISPEICQNHYLKDDYIELDPKTIVGNYLSNNISEAVVIGGLEPFDDAMNLIDLIDEFRKYTSDDIVIYTGYYPVEIIKYLIYLTEYENIIIKFGRYIPDCKPKKDKILGVELISSNQYAAKLNMGMKSVLDALKSNNGYCPCKTVKDETTKCCCREFVNKQVCTCGLFSTK